MNIAYRGEYMLNKLKEFLFVELNDPGSVICFLLILVNLWRTNVLIHKTYLRKDSAVSEAFVVYEGYV